MIKRYDDFIDKLTESTGETFFNNFVSKQSGLNKIILELVKKNISDDDIEALKGTFDQLINMGLESGIIKDLLTTDDIYNFYKKNPQLIDDSLKAIGWFEQSPMSNDIFNLNDFLIVGVKTCIKVSLNDIYKSLFQD